MVLLAISLILGGLIWLPISIRYAVHLAKQIAADPVDGHFAQADYMTKSDLDRAFDAIVAELKASAE